MKRKDLLIICLTTVVAALLAWIVSGAVFNSPASRTKVPAVDKIDPNFPDVKNDSAYNAFFHNDALDSTQPIQIGNTKNTSPFNPSQ